MTPDTRVRAVDTPGSAASVVVANGRAYVADGAAGLVILEEAGGASTRRDERGLVGAWRRDPPSAPARLLPPPVTALAQRLGWPQAPLTVAEFMAMLG